MIPTVADNPALARILDMIVRCCSPQRVLLFGSYAKGTADALSDFDLLVLGRFRESRMLRGREVREMLSRSAIGVDVLFLTEAELEFESRWKHGFFRSALSRSVEIYAEPPVLGIVVRHRQD